MVYASRTVIETKITDAHFGKETPTITWAHKKKLRNWQQITSFLLNIWQLPTYAYGQSICFYLRSMWCSYSIVCVSGNPHIWLMHYFNFHWGKIRMKTQVCKLKLYLSCNYVASMPFSHQQLLGYECSSQGRS